MCLGSGWGARVFFAATREGKGKRGGGGELAGEKGGNPFGLLRYKEEKSLAIFLEGKRRKRPPKGKSPQLSRKVGHGPQKGKKKRTGQESRCFPPHKRKKGLLLEERGTIGFG